MSSSLSSIVQASESNLHTNFFAIKISMQFSSFPAIVRHYIYINFIVRTPWETPLNAISKIYSKRGDRINKCTVRTTTMAKYTLFHSKFTKQIFQCNALISCHFIRKIIKSKRKKQIIFEMAFQLFRC